MLQLLTGDTAIDKLVFQSWRTSYRWAQS